MGKRGTGSKEAAKKRLRKWRPNMKDKLALLKFFLLLPRSPFTLFPATNFQRGPLFGGSRNRESHAVNGSAVNLDVLGDWLGIPKFHSDSIFCRVGCQPEHK